MKPPLPNFEKEKPSTRIEKTRQRILEAARQEFSRHGYSGGTTRSIAAAAGVSELTLFRHFATKKNLFLAMVSRFSALPDLQNTLAESLTGDPQQDLKRIATAFLNTTIARRSEILMTLREAETLPELREISATVPRMQREMLAAYLQRQMERGLLRRMDPDLAAQTFLGMLFAYAIRDFIEDAVQQVPLEPVVSFFVDVFLKGMIE